MTTTIKIGEGRGDISFIQFGDVLMGDPDSSWKLFQAYKNDAGEWGMREAQQGKCSKSKKGRVRLRLAFGKQYMLMADGGSLAGSINTAGHEIIAPFVLKVDVEPSAAVLQSRAAAITLMQSQRPKLNMLGRVLKYVLTAGRQ